MIWRLADVLLAQQRTNYLWEIIVVVLIVLLALFAVCKSSRRQ